MKVPGHIWPGMEGTEWIYEQCSGISDRRLRQNKTKTKKPYSMHFQRAELQLIP